MEKNKAKTILITPGYPSDKNIYNLAFIHTRVKEYSFNVDVFVISNDEYDENFDGVFVHYRKIENIVNQARNYKFILIHFMGHRILKEFINKEIKDKKIIIWIHGTEALSARRRLFNIKAEGYMSFGKYFLWSIKNRVLINMYLRKLNKHNKFGFVFPSSWMKEISEKDLYMNFDNYEIIPNPINDKLFKPSKLDIEKRFKIISIRSYRSYKYGVDILQEIILKFLEDERFINVKDKVEITVLGDGDLFDKNTRLLKDNPFVELHKKFLTQREMAQMFQKYGIFINTTRQDAQGVTMCEAMSSGLVTLNSNNTAIPEFIDGENGILCNDVNAFVDSLYDVIENVEKFERISEVATEYIRNNLLVGKICSEEQKFIYEL
ncbi:glycosyltransferase family 4 protein [Enterococcus gallinarum]|uniref:glycosyltransferase family 4 protein n=1 Tax=Enterococcus gallinarum TaxID=1353 RepID=UPI0035C973F7